MRYIAEDASLRFRFNTVRFSSGAPYTLAGTPSLAVYPEDSATQITTGITLTVDYDSKTGLNDVVIDLSASASYAAGKKYEVQIEAGTVDSVSVVGAVVYEFFIVAAGAMEDLITRGLLALPNAAADAAGGLPISDAGGLDLDSILTNLPSAPPKNTAFTYVIKMVDGTDNVTPETGLTVTMTRSLDGAAFGSATGTVSEISTGHYKVEASAADMNGDVVAHRFTASGAADLTIVFKTVS